MLSRFTAAGLIWPTIFTIVGLGVLVGLGTWQWQRMHWKEDLLAQIAERTSRPPVPLSQVLVQVKDRGGANREIEKPQAQNRQPSEYPPEYLRVTASGRFDYTRERHYYANSGQGPGWHLFTPLMISDGQALWVNRGFVPEPFKDRASRRAYRETSGVVTVTGLVRRPGKPGTFTPANDANANIWYWRDLQAMQASAFDTARQPVQAIPFFIDAQSDEAQSEAWPQAGTTVLKLHNKHFGYALTWWGLALTLVGVYGTFAFQRLRVH